MDRRELELEAMKAASAEEVQSLLKDNNIEISEEEALAFFRKAQCINKKDGSQLDEDELLAVSGGIDYAKDGCEATVEPTSKCWGTDGGCALVNNNYDHMPVNCICRDCGNKTVYLFQGVLGRPYTCRYICKTCGTMYDDMSLPSILPRS